MKIASLPASPGDGGRWAAVGRDRCGRSCGQARVAGSVRRAGMVAGSAPHAGRTSWRLSLPTTSGRRGRLANGDGAGAGIAADAGNEAGRAAGCSTRAARCSARHRPRPIGQRIELHREGPPVSMNGHLDTGLVRSRRRPVTQAVRLLQHACQGSSLRNAQRGLAHFRGLPHGAAVLRDECGDGVRIRAMDVRRQPVVRPRWSISAVVSACSARSAAWADGDGPGRAARSGR